MKESERSKILKQAQYLKQPQLCEACFNRLVMDSLSHSTGEKVGSFFCEHNGFAGMVTIEGSQIVGISISGPYRDKTEAGVATAWAVRERAEIEQALDDKERERGASHDKPVTIN